MTEMSTANMSVPKNSNLEFARGILLYELQNQTVKVNSTFLAKGNFNGTSFALTLSPTIMSSLNNTSIEPNGFPKMHQKFTTFFIVQLVLYFIIVAVGASGNILVLLTIGRIKQMRSVKNFFIGNLATADLITLLLCLPLNMSGYFVSWPFGEFVCQFVFPLTDVVTGSSILTMVAISLDRFRAIVYPFAQKLTLQLTVLTMLFVWALSYLFIGLPLKFAMKLRPGHWVKKSCDLVWPSPAYGHTYRITIFSCFYLFPVTLILLCYLVIGRKLRENLRFASASVRGSKNLERAKKHKRLTTMMFVIFFSFAICMLPINIFFLLVHFHGPMAEWQHTGALYQIAALLFFANSAMNPVILALLSREFRRGFRRNCLCIAFWSKTKKTPGFDNFVRRFMNRPAGGYSDVDSGSKYQSEKDANGTCVTEIELLPLSEKDASARRVARRGQRPNSSRGLQYKSARIIKELGTEVTET